MSASGRIIAAGTVDTGGAISRAVENAAVLLPAAGAAVGFAGFNYYQRLFAHFGLKPGVVDLDAIDIAAHGTDALVYGVVTFFAEGVTRSGWVWPIAFVSTGLLIVLIRRIDAHGRWRQRYRPAMQWFERFQRHALRWLAAILLIAVGYGAGFKGGDYDAAGIQDARRSAVNCYGIAGTVTRGIVLAQDEDTIVLVQADRTIVRPFTAIDIATCPAPALAPRGETASRPARTSRAAAQ